MPHSIVYNKDLHIIETTYHGAVTMEEIKEFCLEIITVSKQHQCFMTLGDYRNAQVSISTLDIYQIPKMISASLEDQGAAPSRFKRAFVTSHSHEDFHFFETVTLNSGQNARIFETIEEARVWLQKPRDNH